MSIEARVESQSTVWESARVGQTAKMIDEQMNQIKNDLVAIISPDEKTIKFADDFDPTEQEKLTKMFAKQAELRQYHSLLVNPTIKSDITETDNIDKSEFLKSVQAESFARLRDNQNAPAAKAKTLPEMVADALQFDGFVGLKNSRPRDVLEFAPSAPLGDGIRSLNPLGVFDFSWADTETASMKMLGELQDNPNARNLKSIYTGAIGNPAQTNPATNGNAGFLCGLEIDPRICIRKSPIMENCFSRVPATGSRILFTREAFESNQMDFVPETIYATSAPLPVQAARIGTKPEVAMGFEDVAVRMAKLAGHIKISEETFEDCPRIIDAVTQVMERYYNEKEAFAVLQEDGVYPNPLGAYNQPGILTSIFRDEDSRGTEDDTRRDFLRRVRTDLRINGCGETKLKAVIHPYDLEEMDLEKDAMGRYLLDVQGDCATREVWCVEFCENAFAVENQMLVGDLPRAVRIHERQSMRVWIGYVGNGALENALTMIVEGRFAVSVCDLWCLLRATGM